MQYKRKKVYKPRPDSWFSRDEQLIEKMILEARQNKRYMRIQNDWKNNLVRKAKKRQRRVEAQQATSPAVPEEPKLVVHR